MARTRRERRRHTMYVTSHTEYHCRGREVVGIRDRGTGRWQRWHPLLRHRLVGAVDRDEQFTRSVEIGAPLVFVGDNTFVTSRLRERGRPPKDALGSYASLATSGMISL